MQITFSLLTQSVGQYISGSSDTFDPSGLERTLIRLLVHQCEQGLITAPQLTFIVEGTTRSDAVFSTP